MKTAALWFHSMSSSTYLYQISVSNIYISVSKVFFNKGLFVAFIFHLYQNDNEKSINRWAVNGVTHYWFLLRGNMIKKLTPMWYLRYQISTRGSNYIRCANTSWTDHCHISSIFGILSSLVEKKALSLSSGFFGQIFSFCHKKNYDIIQGALVAVLMLDIWDKGW